ncbi:MAG TPA: YbaK/EbsC family protein [Tepidiformaceae bacterium]
MAQKPLAVRMLEQRKIPHEVFHFDDAIRSAAGVAEQAGVDPALVYKTLVIEDESARGKPYLVMVPADTEVDLKVLAQSLAIRKLRMASQRDAERLTGLKVGGISALALLQKRFPTLIDERALGQTHIMVSAGQRGFDVRLAVDDLVALCEARPVRVTE